MPGRGLLGEAALEQLRDAAAVLDHLEPALHLAHRVGEHLPVLGGEEPREVLAVLGDELADAEEHLGAARERDRPPGGERLLRRRDGGVDLLERGEVDRAGLLAGRRVVDRAAAARLPGDRPAADPVVDPRDLALLPAPRGLCDFGHLAPPRGLQPGTASALAA